MIKRLDNTRVPHSTTCPDMLASGGHMHFEDHGVSATDRLGDESAVAFTRVPSLMPQCIGVPASSVHVNFDKHGVSALYRLDESPLETEIRLACSDLRARGLVWLTIR